MFYFDGSSGQNTLSPKHGRIPTAASVEVETVTIDEFCFGNRIVPTFIKIDIEGYELHALRGAEHTLRHFRPKLLVEMHPMNWPEIGITASEITEFISHLDYQIVPLKNGEDPFSAYGHAVLVPNTAQGRSS